MAGNSFFTSQTIQKNRLLRPFPQMSSGNGLSINNLPLGKNRAQSIELTLSRRFANGFSGNIVYTRLDAQELTTVNEYDRAPGLWQTLDNARPHRLPAIPRAISVRHVETIPEQGRRAECDCWRLADRRHV